MTPYQYVNNNPINIIDPTVMYGERWEGGGYGDKKGDSWASRAWSEVKSWFGGKPQSTVTVGPIEEEPYQASTNSLAGIAVSSGVINGTAGGGVASTGVASAARGGLLGLFAYAVVGTFGSFTPL